MDLLFDILRLVHSYVRWAVVILAVVAIIKFAIGWVSKSNYEATDRKIMSSFVGLMDLNLTIGIIMLIISLVRLGMVRYQMEHAVTMIIAVVLGHMNARWKKAGSAVRFRNNLFIVVGVMVLVFLGIAVLPQGWSLRLGL